jgi:hypothetical protein
MKNLLNTLADIALILLIGFLGALPVLAPWFVYGDPRCIVAQCRIEVAP